MAGADPTEVVALSDALEDPGDLPYSAAARERFGLLAGSRSCARTPGAAARAGPPDHRDLRHRRRGSRRR
ncbi:MAG: hypothetical protein R2734_05825 [Nocardioides sp.]